MALSNSMNNGERVRAIRLSRGMSQAELARRAGMKPAQLCMLEHGRHEMNGSSLRRLSDALGVAITDILGEAVRTRDVVGSIGRRVNGSDVVPVRLGEGTEAELNALRRDVLKLDQGVLKLERNLGLRTHLTLPLVFPYGIDESAAELLARDMRQSLGVGSMPVNGLETILEMRGVRILRVERQRSFQSLSFFNKAMHTLTIVINAENTNERNTYRLIYELGSAVVFAVSGWNSFRDEAAIHRLLRRFTAAFLMPEETVRMDVARFGIKPVCWTMDILLALKRRFGVSAEAYALRLESLGLIDPSLRIRFRDELRSYYKAHGEAMEPESKLAPASISAHSTEARMHIEMQTILKAVAEVGK